MQKSYIWCIRSQTVWLGTPEWLYLNPNISYDKPMKKTRTPKIRHTLATYQMSESLAKLKYPPANIEQCKYDIMKIKETRRYVYEYLKIYPLPEFVLQALRSLLIICDHKMKRLQDYYSTFAVEE